VIIAKFSAISRHLYQRVYLLVKFHLVQSVSYPYKTMSCD